MVPGRVIRQLYKWLGKVDGGADRQRRENPKQDENS